MPLRAWLPSRLKKRLKKYRQNQVFKLGTFGRIKTIDLCEIHIDGRAFDFKNTTEINFSKIPHLTQT